MQLSFSTPALASLPSNPPIELGRYAIVARGWRVGIDIDSIHVPRDPDLLIQEVVGVRDRTLLGEIVRAGARSRAPRALAAQRSPREGDRNGYWSLHREYGIADTTSRRTLHARRRRGDTFRRADVDGLDYVGVGGFRTSIAFEE